MLFNSIEYLLFFPIVIGLYFLLPYKYRWVLLLAASYYFYMCWKAEYIFLILISTGIDYYAGIQIGKTSERNKKKKYLLLSLISNLSLLFGFKYFNFFNENMRELFNSLNIFYDIPAFNVLLPVGISFYTFQSLSYTIDIYRDNREPERHFGIFALYVAFFPQLVAGPIERSSRLLPQFRKQFDFDYKRVTDGLKLIAWGFFKKLVIADRLAMYVNEVYNHPGEYSGLPVIIATYFFAFQIFCDFSAYSDIAIGTAQVMGYKLMDNFRRPYFSKSISEFWKRWHISLSSWFRDYLYIPLGGNRVAKWRWYYNLIITFLVSGFWHGANWTFLIWGGLHGFYLIFSIISDNIRKKTAAFFRLDKYPAFSNLLKIFVTFHLVLFAWIFFRANSLSHVKILADNMFSGNTGVLLSGLPDFTAFDFLVAIFSILIMEFVHIIQSKGGLRERINSKPMLIRWGLYIAIVLLILNFGVFTENEFIYFQF